MGEIIFDDAGYSYSSGRKTDWLEIEYDIYGRMGNQQKQQAVCRELFICKGGSMENYKRLKKLVPAQEWPDFLSALLSQTKMHAWFSESVEADIYVAEHDDERLFNLLLRDDHHTLCMFDKYALKLHKEPTKDVMSFIRLMTISCVSGWFCPEAPSSAPGRSVREIFLHGAGKFPAPCAVALCYPPSFSTFLIAFRQVCYNCCD